MSMWIFIPGSEPAQVGAPNPSSFLTASARLASMRAMRPKEAAARSIAQRLHEAGYIAYFAGGCVRDRLLGREPQDYDIATNAPAALLQQLFARTIPVGVQFGVVIVVVDGEPVEVATFRSDAAYLNGRHPSSVHFGSAEEDARRRDFTINGMFLDPACRHRHRLRRRASRSESRHHPRHR